MSIILKYWVTIAISLASITFIFLSINQANQENDKGDFFIYWNTGKQFLSGQSFYEYNKEDGAFIYPPFAAMFFSLFSLLPFYVSAVLYCFLINFGLWVLSLWLVWKILKIRFPSTGLILPFAIACICSARYFWHNFIWVQGNMPMLCATLAGIYFYFRGQRNASYFFLLAGAFFKVTPALLIGFLVIKGGSRDLRRVVILSLPFILVPLTLRGLSTGLRDWLDYYYAFVSPFVNGKVDGDMISLGVPAMLHKFKEGNEDLGVRPLLLLSEHSLKKLILTANLAVFLMVSWKILWKKLGAALNGADISMVLLLMLILPGRVWEHHHVTLGFLIAYLMASLQLLMPSRKWLWFAVPMLITGLIGSDTVGGRIYDYSQYFCLITIIVFYLLALIWRFGDRTEDTGVSVGVMSS
jgi:hypothetical protein